MYSSEVKLITFSSGKDGSNCNKPENSPKLKTNKTNLHALQKTHVHHSHQYTTNSNNNRKKLQNTNTTHYYSASGNRKKSFQNNNNTIIKNQNISCLPKNAQAIVNLSCNLQHINNNNNNNVNNNIVNLNSSISSNNHQHTENILTNNNSNKYSTQLGSSKKIHLKTIDCNHNLPAHNNSKNPLQVSMVMSSNKCHPTTQAMIVTATTTTSTSTTGISTITTSSSISSTILSTPTTSSTTTTTNSAAITRSQNISPASYSLDFLHSVGVQMTAGANRNFQSPNISPLAQSTSIGGYSHSNNSNNSNNNNNNSSNNNNININQQMRHRHQYNQENSAILLKDPKIYSTNTHQHNARHNYEIPILIHHPFSRGMMNSPMGNESFGPFHHQTNHGYHGGNYYNNFSHNPHLQNNGPQQYQNISNCSGSSGGGTVYYSGNSGSNSASSGGNRNPPHNSKKSWNSWNQSNNNKKNYSSNNQKLNATPSSSDSNSSQTLPRMKNHQNYHNLKYVTTDSMKYVRKSRSPTPSTKSESPTLVYNAPTTEQTPLTNIKCKESGKVSCLSLSKASDQCDTDVESLKVIDSHNLNLVNNNGYESDSSHSSYKPIEYDYNVKNFPMASGGYNQVGEITSLLNFPTYSDEDLTSQLHYYGSQQNLSFWNQGFPSNCNPHHQSIYNINGISPGSNSSDLIDPNMSLKKGHFNNKVTFRGRRSLHTNLRSQFPQEYNRTPPDKFLARAHLIEAKETPEELLNGSKWDNLSQNIWSRFVESQQTMETFKKKMVLWRYLYILIKKTQPRYGLYLVGSTISGFGADTSDVDMCLVSRLPSSMDQRMEAVINLNILKECLMKSGDFENFNLIEAKVPILRFRDKLHFLEVDLNYNNCVGIKNTHLLYCYSQLDWRLRPLVLITKLWAQFHNINNAKNMTISSYSLVLMVIHFLQCATSPPILPCLHELYPEKFQIILKSNDFGYVDMNEFMAPFGSQNHLTLGELFLQFLEYYSNFNYSQYAISIRTGSLLPIETCRQAKTLKNDIHQWKELCIEEPFDLTNTARSVYDGVTFDRVKAVFITSWKVLEETMDLNSIFSNLISMQMPTEIHYPENEILS